MCERVRERVRVRVFSLPGGRVGLSERVTFLQFSIPRFLLRAGAPGWPDARVPQGGFISRKAKFASADSFLLTTGRLPKSSETGVLPWPAPPQPSHQEGPPVPLGHTIPAPQQCARRSRLTPDLYPALPTLDRKEFMHLLLTIIYFFGETNAVKV